MSKELGTKAWRYSGKNARYIDSFSKRDQYLAKKAKEQQRQELDVDRAVEALLKAVGVV